MALTLVRSMWNRFNHVDLVPLRDGQQLHVRVIGTSMGQPVLMLPGLGMSASVWLPFIARYTHQYRFYLPDLRGEGQSADLEFNQADVYQNHMEDIADLINHYQLEDILLVGYSLGATTSMHLQRAGLFGPVKRYLHIDQTPCIRNTDEWRYGLTGERQEQLFERMQHVLALLKAHPHAVYLSDVPKAEQTEIIAVMQQIIQVLNGDKSPEDDLPAWQRYLVMGLLPMSRRLPLSKVSRLLAYFTAYSGDGHDYRDSLTNFPVPVTQIVGMKSPFYDPRGQMEIAHRVPRGKVIRFERSGHVPLLTEPAKFIRTLGIFLQHEDGV